MNILEEKISLKPGLYIIATPIGNLDDITLRAIKTLNSVDIILCEDTRHSQKLLYHYNIKKSLWSYNDHSTETTRNKIIDAVKNGHSVAIISDAGTPLISDPGYKLVESLYEQNLFITSCPGACSPISAIAISGCPTNKFLFAGFLPIQQKEREAVIADTKSASHSTILFSTSRKLEKDLEDILDICGDVKICLLRELTKIFEQRIFTNIKEIILQNQKQPFKGEIVLIIPPQESTTDMNKISIIVEKLKKQNFSSKDIVKIISALDLDLSKKEIYNMTT